MNVPFAASDCGSDLSLSLAAAPERSEVEFRGLSDFEAPAILDRIEPRKDRADSLVSDLLNEGYESSEGPDLSSGVRLPSLFFDG